MLLVCTAIGLMQCVAGKDVFHDAQWPFLFRRFNHIYLQMKRTRPVTVFEGP